jgi:hypothetical protein
VCSARFKRSAQSMQQPLDLATSEVEVEPSQGVSDPNSGAERFPETECEEPTWETTRAKPRAVDPRRDGLGTALTKAREPRKGQSHERTRAPRRRNAASAGDCEGCGATTAGAREPTPALRKRRRSTERCRQPSRCSSCRRPQGQQSVIGNHAATPSCDRRRQNAHRRGAALPVEDREIGPCGHDAEGHAA